MRTPFVAGNWKMNLTRAESLALVQGLLAELSGVSGVDVAVCPPFVYLDCVLQATRGSSLGVGAQNMYCRSQGRFYRRGERRDADRPGLPICDPGAQRAAAISWAKRTRT